MSRILPVEDFEVWGDEMADWTDGLRAKSWSFMVAWSRVVAPTINHRHRHIEGLIAQSGSLLEKLQSPKDTNLQPPWPTP